MYKRQNIDAGFAINRLQAKPQQIILAHLSEQNNSPDIALNTIKQIFQENNLTDISLHVASPDRMLNIIMNKVLYLHLLLQHLPLLVKNPLHLFPMRAIHQ